MDIDVDAGGNAYATGYTTSQNFPTRNALQSTLAGTQDVFVTKFNPEGTPVYSTYFGGSGIESTDGGGIAVDVAGSVYLVGHTSSTDFPTHNPLQPAYGGGQWDAFITKLAPDGRALIYSTYFGSSGTDRGNRIAVDSLGNAYVTLNVDSNDVPTVSPVQPAYGGGTEDSFLAKLSPDGRTLIYSTFHLPWRQRARSDSRRRGYRRLGQRLHRRFYRFNRFPNRKPPAAHFRWRPEGWLGGENF
ncbi:MAG: hypothetical protein DMG14_32420 [Acidobacteria bacterium]|nr:MAG: hypothetical protein DMG14_32420 [Acidobacteriota bacterium]